MNGHRRGDSELIPEGRHDDQLNPDTVRIRIFSDFSVEVIVDGEVGKGQVIYG